jgi:tetratricopeptide (TPR) repeat protein
MEKFDMKSARLVSILIFICLIFTIVVWHAYKYLPSEDMQAKNQENEVVLPTEENNSQSEEKETEVDENSSENVKADLNKDKVDQPDEAKQEAKALEPLEPIDGNDSVQEVETPESVMQLAIQHKNEKQYTKAIMEFKKAASMYDKNDQRATCYAEISDIYAISKRYGTALSYAQQAYNMSPSTNRELMLARLYYKTGDIDKATRRVNNILQRDFELEK